MHGVLTWVDLSALDLGVARRFYSLLFGWQVLDDRDGYLTCAVGQIPVAGLYPMPDFFRGINMPSFWMTTITVDDLDAAVAKAKELGAKIELQETNALGRVALIRDPAGAGFTCYEGDAEPARSAQRAPGRWAWSELFVSDLASIQGFYESLFGWSIRPIADDPDRYRIHHADGEAIGAVQVAPNEVKGDKEYWAVFFAASDVSKVLNQVANQGGTVLSSHTNHDGTHHLIQDPQGAACYLTDAKSSGVEPVSIAIGSGWSGYKWRTVLGLVVIYAAVITEAQWIWGILFLIWVLPDLFRGTTYFIEPLHRRSNPVLYWIVVMTWLVFAGYALVGL